MKFEVLQSAEYWSIVSLIIKGQNSTRKMKRYLGTSQANIAQKCRRLAELGIINLVRKGRGRAWYEMNWEVLKDLFIANFADMEGRKKDLDSDLNSLNIKHKAGRLAYIERSKRVIAKASSENLEGYTLSLYALLVKAYLAAAAQPLQEKSGFYNDRRPEALSLHDLFFDLSALAAHHAGGIFKYPHLPDVEVAYTELTLSCMRFQERNVGYFRTPRDAMITQLKALQQVQN